MATRCIENCLECMTPTYCIKCEEGYSYYQTKNACEKTPLMSESTKAVLVSVGAVTGFALVGVVVYKLLSKFRIINKKIDPRKIRAFNL